MRVVYFLLLLYSRSSAYTDRPEGVIELDRKMILEQIKTTQTVLFDDYHLVTRQIAISVNMYRGYRTVSVIFYPIMRDVIDARFTFQSEELHLNNIGVCRPRDVIINLKHGSYPAVNPDGYDFPKNFIDPGTREEIHTIQQKSDGKTNIYSIKNPKPGNWYALVYIKWEDPSTHKVGQQGLVADCRAILYTDLQVKREEDIRLIDCYAGATVNYANVPIYYKCMTVDSTYPISLSLTIVSTENSNKNLRFRVQALSLPTDENYLISCAFDPKLNNTQVITFNPYPTAWHYIHIDTVPDTFTKIADCESYYSQTDSELDNNTALDLMRDDKGRFFTFDYGLPTPDVQDATSLVNLTSSEIKTLRYKVNQFVDIGGTLTIETSLLMSLKYYMGYRRQIKEGDFLTFTEDNQFFRVVICVDVGHASIPLKSGHCKYNDRVKPALFVLNSTDSESIYDKVIIPYPDSGMWYVTFKLFCDSVVCPCRTSHNGTKYYVDAQAFDRDTEDLSSELSNYTREGERECNATVVLSISSSSCSSGTCSNGGRCLLEALGGQVMSFCACTAGYGAWDCSDDSRMDSRADMLLSILLLTLSNLLFFFSVYVGIIRLYFTEAVMYAFAMLFSTFYHACDAPTQVQYCIVKGTVLQFGDFYCGIMSFWVSLLAMAIINEQLRSLLQLSGAIVIALLTKWNMRSIISFSVPVAVGVTLMFVSWYCDWRKNHRMKYPRSYYTRYLPIGLVLVSIGLICYAFLQTQENYRIVHSFWHMIIAMSVVFLLPDVKREGVNNPFLPSTNDYKLPFCKVFSRSQTAIATDNQS